MKNNSSDQAARNIILKNDEFHGYTLEEIRYQRALVSLQLEFCKNKIIKNFANIQKVNPLSPTSVASSFSGKAGAVIRKLLNGLNYLDYAVLGFSLFSSIRKITSFFRKKKA